MNGLSVLAAFTHVLSAGDDLLGAGEGILGACEGILGAGEGLSSVVTLPRLAASGRVGGPAVIRTVSCLCWKAWWASKTLTKSLANAGPTLEIPCFSAVSMISLTCKKEDGDDNDHDGNGGWRW
eukprot:GHVU01118675.1.p2 GENE.GHVU01118675.1~~GHVU01118675.1.p2  ORF type:complete len:124 (-),score=10.85 GHVU01118675.1:752-1123(-)